MDKNVAEKLYTMEMKNTCKQQFLILHMGNAILHASEAEKDICKLKTKGKHR